MLDHITMELNAREAEEARHTERLPKCCECGEPIHDEKLYNIHGELYCEDCMWGFRERTEYYIED